MATWTDEKRKTHRLNHLFCSVRNGAALREATEVKFQIEQVALYPRDPKAARELLVALGLTDWVEDHVAAEGSIMQLDLSTLTKKIEHNESNEADLAFNYQAFAGKELEILHYTSGRNWMQMHYKNSVSHFGMHCTSTELAQWREFFAARGIGIAQEVMTKSHTNPAIKDKRVYNYVIFDTHHILGVDLKFIVRYDNNGD